MTARNEAAPGPGGAAGGGGTPPGHPTPDEYGNGGNPPGNATPGGDGNGVNPPGDAPPGRIILILGGIRSGKSRLAERLAAQLAGAPESVPALPDNPALPNPGHSAASTGGAHPPYARPYIDEPGDIGGSFAGNGAAVGAPGEVGGGDAVSGSAGGAVLYLATGVAVDEAMTQRIAAHRVRRPAHWLTLETPQHPAEALRECQVAGWPANGGTPPPVVLLDSVDGWIANLLLAATAVDGPPPGNEADGNGAADTNESPTAADRESAIAKKEAIIKEAMAQTGALLRRLRAMPGACILVSSEVGLSLVAETTLGRQFQDVLGLVNQELAAAAQQVYLSVAGLPLQIKPPPSRPIDDGGSGFRPAPE